MLAMSKQQFRHTLSKDERTNGTWHLFTTHLIGSFLWKPKSARPSFRFYHPRTVAIRDEKAPVADHTVCCAIPSYGVGLLLDS